MVNGTVPEGAPPDGLTVGIGSLEVGTIVTGTVGVTAPAEGVIHGFGFGSPVTVG